MPSDNPWLSRAEAGAIIRKAREGIPLTQDQVAEAVGVDKSYISKLEGGQHHAGRSKYFPQLVRVLRLTPEDVARLNPIASLRGAASPDPAPRRRPLPAALQEMIDEKQALAPELSDERWQQYLAKQRFATGSATPERWWNLFLVLKNAGIEPGGN